VTGKPSLATREKGERLFVWMVEDLSAIVRRGMKEESPLPHAYNESI
jgi:creatinine amidohydrolase